MKSIDTSKIQVGDWVEYCRRGWYRVRRVLDSTMWIKYVIDDVYAYSGEITGHRSKDGPFKAGDEVWYKSVSPLGKTPMKVAEVKSYDYPSPDLVCYDNDSWVYDTSLSLVTPVEAIEAEQQSVNQRIIEGLRKYAKDLESCDDLRDINEQLAERGYRIERVERPVTLEDLPKPCDGEWEDSGPFLQFRAVGDEISWLNGCPAMVLQQIDEMARQRIAAGGLDAEVRARMEVIGDG